MEFSIVTVFDTSGSFIEMAKARINRNIWRTLLQLRQLYPRDDLLCRTNVEYYSWGLQMLSLPADPVAGTSVLKASGRADVSVLSEFIVHKNSSAKQPLPLLICTDGAFSNDELKLLKGELLKACHIIPIVIAVGIDADIDNLQMLTPFVFYPENILEAVDYAVSFNGGIAKCPERLDDISVISVEDLLSAAAVDEEPFCGSNETNNLLDIYQYRLMKF